MTPRPPKPPRVAVVIEASNAYARGLLAGIHRHVREHEPWTVFLPEHGRGAPPLEQLAGWRGDGVIARVETPAIAAVLARISKKQTIPIIDVSAARLLPAVPYVETDDEAIGRVAADHFAERDFRHYGFVGVPRFRWSENRCRAFTAAANARGHAVDVFPGATGRRGRPRVHLISAFQTRCVKLFLTTATTADNVQVAPYGVQYLVYVIPPHLPHLTKALVVRVPNPNRRHRHQRRRNSKRTRIEHQGHYLKFCRREPRRTSLPLQLSLLLFHESHKLIKHIMQVEYET
jgi:hypothetical protein